MEQPAYTIQEAAVEGGVTPHTLRYYEKIGLLKNIQRDTNGHRRYTEVDLGWVYWLKLLRNSGMSIQMMRQYVELTHAGEQTAVQRCQILDEHRQALKAHIEQLQASLAMLDKKVAFFREMEQAGEQIS